MSAYRVACGYALLALTRNRLAAVLLVVFVPLWITVAEKLTTRRPFPFLLRATGTFVHAGGDKITMISGSLNAVSLLVGFLMFGAARRTGAFDRRLAAAGYPRRALLAAKLAALLAAAVLVSAYATAWMLLYWSPEQPWLLWLAVLAVSLVYGVMGLFLALFLPGEVEGMVAIIMISIIDLAPQNPVASTTADNPVLGLLPSYGSLQTSLQAGFTHHPAPVPLLHSLVWLAVLAVVALTAFTRRTRVATRHNGG
ncbi:hypothetical protein [Streptantibioticus cattleyicolor]|uniref:Integral membrane protein n=1 Tax=Streptantibioticus cattleyicolor (strain ATCC 35852 / DSM 46488 / JCM 4925 / NBRC 14057 / NRRL 8057) TaxID=1003195 RepID=F8JJT2_STREN|nr:hypothetical protein [Streptantibioticus cattleyicolor]AEW98641.1 integral membrane protein [Streptantibioticus cattleyicolor NRRL 8057 = DSM 46488]CCB72299.1 conserved membrane protein of unknown function [Streptantibioticus cattleyicolor NRRL 8057 = DSM 46488]